MRARRLARKLADTSSQQRLLKALAETFSLPRSPRRIEVYDNSHISGSNAVGAMIVAGPEGFRKNQYRKFNIRSADLAPGDDYGMMREVLQRRFKRLMEESPRIGADAALAAVTTGDLVPDEDYARLRSDMARPGADRRRAGPVARRAGDAGGAWASLTCRWWPSPKGRTATPAARPSSCGGQEPVQVAAARPAALFHRAPARRGAPLRHRLAPHPAQEGHPRGGLQEIPGIGPTRKRALLHHFGTVKAIERASLPDLANVPGINAETARKIYDFFHENAGQTSRRSE